VERSGRDLFNIVLQTLPVLSKTTGNIEPDIRSPERDPNPGLQIKKQEC
jgi:hypothetical protein